MKVALHAVVRGRVQGVSFRYATQEEALKLGLRGWVRNRTTGEVEAMIEGDEASVRSLLKFLRTGPPTAEVEEVVTSQREYSGEFSHFSIAPTVE
jgi:acylphosphatase